MKKVSFPQAHLDSKLSSDAKLHQRTESARRETSTFSQASLHYKLHEICFLSNSALERGNQQVAYAQDCCDSNCSMN